MAITLGAIALVVILVALVASTRRGSGRRTGGAGSDTFTWFGAGSGYDGGGGFDGGGGGGDGGGC